MTMLRLLSSESKINCCEYALGLLCAIAICVATYFLLMAAYFVVRRKKPSAKYGIELIFVVIAMLLSVLVKLAILPSLAEDASGNVQEFSVVEYIGYSLSAIYSMIGGLQFEGLPFGMTSISSGIAACLYYGSSIISGLIVLSIITAKASYEIFSLVIIKVLKRRRDVYIFNCLTPDALLLAEDIVDHHQKELAAYKKNKDKNPNLKKPRKALILFAGNNIPAFSRNDPNCREVMSQSFYYYSLMKGKDTKKSLFSRLKLRRKNISLLNYQPTNLLTKESVDCLPNQNINNNSNKKDKNERLRKKGNKTRIMELYFTLDENKKPMQEKNTFDAFSELDMIIDDLFYKRATKVRAKKEYVDWFKSLKGQTSKADEDRAYRFLSHIGLKSSWTITEQFILTQGETNYQYYASQIDERVNKIFEHLLNRPLRTYFGSRGAKNILASYDDEDKFTLKNLREKQKRNKEKLEKFSLKNLINEIDYSSKIDERDNKEVEKLLKCSIENNPKINKESISELLKYGSLNELTLEDFINKKYDQSQFKEKIAEMIENILKETLKSYFGSKTTKRILLKLGEREDLRKYVLEGLKKKVQTLKELIKSLAKEGIINGLIEERKPNKEFLRTFSLENLMDRIDPKFASEFKKILQKYVYSLLQVNLVNESYLSSLSLIDERYNKLGASSIWEHLASVDDTSGNKNYKALILGFGGNGQSALHALYYASPHLEEDGSSTGFYADVFDTNIDEIEGMFAKNHPLYRCYPSSLQDNDERKENKEGIERTKSKKESIKVEKETIEKADVAKENVVGNKGDKDADKEDEDINKNEIMTIYRDLLSRENYPYKKLCDIMQFPKIYFHKGSCSSVDFIKFFDKKTGMEFTEIEAGDKKNKEYNMIVIALGSDSANIAVANTIIDDIKRELYLEFSNESKTRNKRRQCIAVNIRDKNNLRKLNWNENDFKKGLFKNVVVFPFGAKEDIYTFNRIIDHSSMYEFNTNYNNMTQKMDKLDIDTKGRITLDDRFRTTMNTLSKLFKVECDERDEVKFDDLFFEIYQERNNADSGMEKSIKYNLSYFKLTNFKKETNRISNVYSRIMRRAVKHFFRDQEGKFALELGNIRKLVMLEHERWNRFMISHGWVYAKKRDDVQKMHKALLPMEEIPEKTFAYDIVNVIPEVYKIYNHCHILYKSLIKNSSTVDDVCSVLTHFLSYYERNHLINAKYDIEKLYEKKIPMIKITFDPNPDKTSGNDQGQETVLFSMHYDLNAQYDIHDDKVDLLDNSVYVDDYGVPSRAFSVYGGADDLAGVACVLYGIVSALKEHKQNKVEIKRKIMVLISGGEERGAQGIKCYLRNGGKVELENKVKECVVVDLNDRVGIYSTKGSRAEIVSLDSPIDLDSKLKDEDISYKKIKKTHSESETRLTVKLRLSGKNRIDSIEKTKETLKELSKKGIQTWFNLRTKQIIATQKTRNDSESEDEILISKTAEEELLISKTANAIAEELICSRDFSSGELDKWVQLSIPLALKDTLEGFNVDYDDSKTTVEITEITTKEKIKVKDKKVTRTGERIVEMSLKESSGAPSKKSEDFSFRFSICAENENRVLEKKNALIRKLTENHPEIVVNTIVSMYEFNTDEHSAPVERLKNAINAADVKCKSVTLEKSFCDANVIAHELGVPTVLLASGAMNAHQEGEYVYLDDLDKNVEIIKNYIVD